MGLEWVGNILDEECVSVSVNQCLSRKMPCKTAVAVAVVQWNIFNLYWADQVYHLTGWWSLKILD